MNKHCFTCGRLVTEHDRNHNPRCPDHPRNRNRIERMSLRTYAKLIPVGTWAYDSESVTLGEILRHDNRHYTPREAPFE